MSANAGSKRSAERQISADDVEHVEYEEAGTWSKADAAILANRRYVRILELDYFCVCYNLRIYCVLKLVFHV
jgi:hypothetical protein